MSITILTKIGKIRNNKNSMKVKYSNVRILLSLVIDFFFQFTCCLLLNVCSYKVVTVDCHGAIHNKLLILKNKIKRVI